MSKLGIAKFVIKTTVGLSAAYCTSEVIEANVDPDTTEEKVKLFVGSMVIGSMVAANAKQYVDDGVDNLVELWQSRKAEKDAAEIVAEAAA